MAERPHDVTDLYLAPVLLEADSRLEQLGSLGPDDLSFQVTLETNIEPRDAAGRRKALLETVRRRVDLHGWKLSLTDRGLAVEHDDRRIVLGLPENLREYIAD